MAAISWSIKSHGMLFMEHDEPDQPWKIFHDHAMIVERQSCSIDHEKVTMIFLDHGKPTMVSITGSVLLSCTKTKKII